MLCVLGAYAYGCGGSGPTDPGTSSSGDVVSSSSSSSGDVVSSSSSGSSSGDVVSSSSSSSGQTTSSSSGSSGELDGSVPDATAPSDCTVIRATQWQNASLCGGGNATCPNVFESEFTPVFPNTFIDFVRLAFDINSTQPDTMYDFSLDPAVWQRDLAGVVGNSAVDARYFKAASGQLRVTSVTPASNSVDARVINVKLVEVTYNDQGAAVPVEGGACLFLNSNVTVQNAE